MKLRRLNQAPVKGKTVLLRVDFNVPLEHGRVADTTRIQETLPTIKYLLQQKAKVIILSHLGRPDGKKRAQFSLKPVSNVLSKMLHSKVDMASDCVGSNLDSHIKRLTPEGVLLLENVRFHHEDERNDVAFAKKLAHLADIFIFDAFGTAHRNHASVSGVARLLPSYAGFLVQKEVDTLSGLRRNPRKPLTLVVGGAKIESKIGLFKSFFDCAQTMLVGGGIANTFLAGAGYNVGKSLYQKNRVSLAQEIMLEAEKRRVKFVLPKDVVVASNLSHKSQSLNIPVEDVEGDMHIFDLGKLTTQHYSYHLKTSRTVLWNGPLGLFEYEQFAKSTKVIARMLSKMKKVDTIIGGGDTIDAIKNFNIKPSSFTHVSTGGGAMLTFLSGEEMPGLEGLMIQGK